MRFTTFAGCFLLLGACAGPVSGSEPSVVSASFTEAREPLPNPERGFYRASRQNLDRLDAAFLAGVYGEGYRLVYARIDLEPYRTAPLPPAFLRALEEGFETARRSGVKLIVRAVYNYPRGETQYRDAQDAPLAIVLQHVKQLEPLLRGNADVVAFVQAGLVGAWGEWHTSSNGLTEPAAREAIKDALLAAVPEERFVQFRYPPYIAEWSGSPRVGFHNDCFLASQTDVGTYSEEPEARAAQQERMDRLGDAAPFGGETCNPADDPGALPRTSCADILREGARYDLTYLNADYYRRIFHDNWAREGCLDEVAGRMGYRLRLLDVSHPASVAPGQGLTLAMKVRNDGWARPFNPRAVELLLRGSDGKVRRIAAAGADPRSWTPGADHEAVLTATVPADLAPGRYEMLVALPDPAERLRGDPRFAIRPANADDSARRQGWEPVLGAFRLGTRLLVRR